MIIRRATRPRQFMTVDMALMNDERLSAEALGVLLYLLSKPDDWRVSIDQLKGRFGIGRDKMQSIMRLLRDCGYARLEQMKDAQTGRLLGQGYSIHDEASNTAKPKAAAADVVPAKDEGATTCDREPENPALGEGPTENRLFRLPDSPTAGKPSSILNTELVLNTERDLSPQPPETGGGAGLSLWEKFETGWAWDVMESREPAKRAFEQLDAIDQTHAARFAKTFCEIAARRQRRKVNASKWLRDRGWENIAQQAGKGAPVAMVTIWAGTPQAAAWARHERKPKIWMTEMTRADGRKAMGVLRPTEWPPSSHLAATLASGSPAEGASP